MATITLEVSEGLARRLAERPDGNAFAVGVLAEAFLAEDAGGVGADRAEDDAALLNALDADLIADVRAGVADVQAGRTRPLPEFMEEQRARWAERARQGALEGESGQDAPK